METPTISSYATSNATYSPDMFLLAKQALPEQKHFQMLVAPSTVPPKQEKPMADKTPRRIVQVYIADTDDNVPLNKSVIYQGEQKLTDLTDQELFFEVEIKSILDKHNAYRTTLVNKKVKERTENLEPVKIRDLKMVVVNVATF